VLFRSYVYQESRSIDIDLIPEVPGPVAEGISTDLPDDERSGAVDGDDLFATDTVRATMEPEDDATHVAEASVPLDTSGTTGDDVASDSAGLAGDGGPDEAVAETVVLPDTAGISGDGSPDVVNDDAVSGAETNTPQDDAGVSLQDVADATGAETGGEESWDEPVFASGDTVQESAVADVGESDSQHTIYGTPGAGSRIELRAVGETWVQVRAPDGIAVLTHILLPGDVYHVPERDDLMLDTGNAGGLEIRVDGELMPPLGGSGAVVRDILLSVESLTRR